MLGTILVGILVLVLVGALPRWSHSRSWGYAPTGGVVHYVRTGDFVGELLLRGRDGNEDALPWGALSHYTSAIARRPAVNQAVPIADRKLRAKFGKSVRYAQQKTAHLKPEFGFDR